jgi:hypothetical protein
MQSNGGLKEHEDIIVDILRDCRCRKSFKEGRSDSRKLRDARQILSSQGALIDRLKTIEAEFKAPWSNNDKL